MARPKKNTVDYFPHYCDCSNKKTLYIIEQKFGNDGYAFWFKLLELIGSTDGHVIDCSNTVTWEFLQAKTRVSGDKCKEIIDLLVELGAIDRELWKDYRIWSDNFVHNIADVYKNRRVETPSRPSFYEQKPSGASISTGENPQSKVKESKVKESKVKKELLFDSLWSDYPKKDGKKAALNHYKATVKTEQDEIDIKQALQNYKKSVTDTEIKFIKNGSTWFNNWKDWVDYQETKGNNNGKNNSFSKRKSVEKAKTKSEQQPGRKGTPSKITIED